MYKSAFIIYIIVTNIIYMYTIQIKDAIALSKYVTYSLKANSKLFVNIWFENSSSDIILKTAAICEMCINIGNLYMHSYNMAIYFDIGELFN